MSRTLLKKLSNERGETIIEVLVALTIAGLAMVMLAMAISVGFNILNKTETARNDYYESSAELVDVLAGSGGSDASVSVSCDTLDINDSIPVVAGVAQSSNQAPAIAYRAKSSDETAGDGS